MSTARKNIYTGVAWLASDLNHLGRTSCHCHACGKNHGEQHDENNTNRCDQQSASQGDPRHNALASPPGSALKPELRRQETTCTNRFHLARVVAGESASDPTGGRGSGFDAG